MLQMGTRETELTRVHKCVLQQKQKVVERTEATLVEINKLKHTHTHKYS